MTEYEKQEIDNVIDFIDSEMKILDKKDEKEKLGRAIVLDRLFKIVRDYDEITPILEQYYELKHYRDKWGKER